MAISLGNSNTVFQAEVTAIRKSAEMLLGSGHDKQNITFYSDSQASLAALNKLTVNSDTVEKCLNALNALGKKNKVEKETTGPFPLILEFLLIKGNIS